MIGLIIFQLRPWIRHVLLYAVASNLGRNEGEGGQDKGGREKGT